MKFNYGQIVKVIGESFYTGNYGRVNQYTSKKQNDKVYYKYAVDIGDREVWIEEVYLRAVTPNKKGFK